MLAATSVEVVIFIIIGLVLGGLIAAGAVYTLYGGKAKAAETARLDAVKEVEKLKEGGADGKLALEQAKTTNRYMRDQRQVEARTEAR